MNDAMLRDVPTLADLRAWPETLGDLPPAARPCLAVLGDPVAHSLSPVMHDAALAAAGLPGRYVPLHIRREELPEALRLLPSAGLVGANLTLPHKTAALAAVPEIEPDAHRLGAINTVRVEASRRTAAAVGGVGPPGSLLLRGHNTDGPGLLLALRDALGIETLTGQGVLVLGAGGGAGRALAVQCALAGCARLVLANRTVAKAAALAEELRQEFAAVTEIAALSLPEAPWNDAPLAGIDLVLHTTPLGLRDADPPALSPGCLRGRGAGLRIYDTVYRRDGRPTPLVAAAHDAGLEAADGLPLLLWQGALAFEIWFERPAPVAAMRAALLGAHGGGEPLRAPPTAGSGSS